MTKYYKGYLFEQESLRTFGFDWFFANYDEILNCTDEEILKLYQELDYETKKKIEKYFNKYCKDDRENQSQIYDILTNKVFTGKKYQKDIPYRHMEAVIYEIIEDENHDLYGKELLTGAIFPIAKSFQKKYSEEIEKVEYAKFNYCSDEYKDKQNTVFLLGDDGYYWDKKDKYILRKPSLTGNDDWLFPVENSYRLIGTIKKYKGVKTHLTLSFEIPFTNLLRGEVYIENICAANESEIEEYKEKNSKLERTKLFGKKEPVFLNRINSLAKLNVFKGEIIPLQKEEAKRKDISSVSSLLMEIDYLLLKLKDYSEELYQIYSNKYNEMLNNNGKLTTNPLNKVSLEVLKANILLSFNFDKNKGMNIIEYLENRKREYLEHLLKKDDVKTEITINDLDKIMDLYLDIQNEYDALTQRKIVRNISLLYLFELYENKDLIDVDMLKNSYLNDLIQNIIVILKTLSDLGLLEKNVYIDLANTNSLEDLMLIVSNIEFRKLDEEKIKKISF